MASLLDASTPLNQLGQSYAGQTNPNPPASQGGGARTWGDLLSANFGGRPIGAFWNQAFGNRPLPDEMIARLNNPNSGTPQTSNYAAAGAPPNPPATGNQFGGTGTASGTTSSPGADSLVSGAPASGMAPAAPGAGPLNYWGGQQPPMMGRNFNAGGPGGFGAMYGGQGRGLGTNYWARLNNIGGT